MEETEIYIPCFKSYGHAWVFSGHSGFLPQSKDMSVGWIDQSKSAYGQGVSVSGWSSVSVSQGPGCIPSLGP